MDKESTHIEWDAWDWEDWEDGAERQLFLEAAQFGARFALMLASNTSMKSLEVMDFPNELADVIAEALEHNNVFKSCKFRCDYCRFYNGIAQANLLTHND